MALFGRSRDISLFRSISNELIKDIIQTEVGYYKLTLQDNPTNIYGENQDKVYYEPLRIACLINREDQNWKSDDFGLDVNQTVSFRFLRDTLVDLNLVPEIGDILLFNGNFYETDVLVENQLFVGKQPDYSISEDTRNHGSSISIILNTHITRIDKLNLVPLRGNVYPKQNVDPGDTPANEIDIANDC